MHDPLRILILEDSPTDAELIRFELEEAGFSYISKITRTEKEFIHELQEFSPGLILSDYDLPDYTGALALTEATRRCPDTPFILVTGAVTEDRAIEILTHGAKDYVLKNRIQQRLVPAIRRALAEVAEHRARKQAEEELREAHAELEQKVRERTAALETEIKERKRAEANLRESEERLRTFLDNSATIAWLKDEEGRYIFVSAGSEKRFGLRLEDLKGKTDFDIWPHGAEELRRNDRAVLESGSPAEMIESIVAPGGDVSWWLTNKFVFRDASGQRYVGGLGVDITQRKHAEDALRQRTEELAAVMDALPAYIWFGADPECRVITGNRTAGELIGIAPETNVSQSVVATGQAQYVRQLKADGTEYRPDELPMQQAIATRQMVRDAYVDFRLPDGRRVQTQGNAAPLFDAAGEIRGSVAAFWDVTALKQAEETQRAYAAKLETAYKNMESFSFSVSHDLRAPLRAIDGFARMILKKQGDQFDDFTRDKFEKIRNNAASMGRMIDSLLEFSRIGRQKISSNEINMDALIREVWEELAGINPEREMSFKAGVMPVCHGDRNLIRQVLVNLLDNAVKFTGKCRTAQVEAGGRVDGKEHVYHIKDNGVGFDMAFYDKVFGVFRRLHHNDEFKGMGVGLANVQQIIKKHGGRVWAEGKINEGATFYFSLPSSPH